jgi:hypothetical protein
MEFPKFCLPYMANDGRLPSLERFRAKWTAVRVKKTRQNNEPRSDFNQNGQGSGTRGHMTHLSWDESGPCVLENGAILAGADGDMPPPGGVDGEYLK